jgi:3-aminoavenalumate diazotase
MDNIALKRLARDKLYEDRELGCGNFLFKARELSPTQATPFLFLERPFTTPFGETFAEFSFDTLYAVVKSLAQWYISQRIRERDIVCTFLEDGIAHFIHYLALNSINATVAIINNKIHPAVVAQYTQQNGFKTFVFDRVSEPNPEISTALNGLRQINAEEPGKGHSLGLPTGWPAKKVADDIVMICHSSGTTAVPKAVIFTHDQHFIGKRERLRQFIEDPEDRMVTGMPPAHSAGISYLMTAVMLELPTLVLSKLTGPSVAANIMQFKPSIVTGFSQTWASLTEQDLFPNTFSSVKRFYNTGDTAHQAHISKMLRLAPLARFIDGYGASELGMAQFEKVSKPGDLAPKRCVGRPRFFVDSVIIIDASGNPLPNGQVGYIAIKSPTITPGYYNQPLLTQLSRHGPYWLTGDVGYKTAEGDYYQLDRTFDVITTAFGPLYSLATEEFLQTIPGVHDAVVIGAQRTPLNIHSTAAIIVPEKARTIDPNVVLGKLHQLVPFNRNHLPPFTLCVAIVADINKLPVGCTGKMLKRSLRDSFWHIYRAYTSGDRDTFLDVVWNTPMPTERSESPQ